MHSTVAASPALQRRLRANLRLFVAFRALTMFMALGPIWVVYLQEDRGLSLGQVTAMEGPFWLALVLLEVPTGVVADRFGRRVSLLGGAFVNFAAIALFAVADSYPILFASYMLWAAGLTLLSGADGAFYYDTLKALGRAGDYQKLWGRMWAVAGVATGVGVLVGGPLGSWLGLQAPILLTAFASLAAMLVGMAFLEPPGEEGGEGAPRPGMIANTRIAIGLIRSSRPILFLMSLGAVFTGTVMAADVLVQPYLRGHEVDIAWFGPLLLPGRLFGIAGALVAYRLTAALGLRGVLLMILALTAAPLMGLAGADSVAAFAVYPLFGAVGGVLNPIISDYVNRRIPSTQRATVLSFSQLLFSLVAAGLVPAAGQLGDAFGLRAAYGAMAVFVLLAAVPLVVAFLRADRAAGRPIDPESAQPKEAALAQPASG